MFKLNWLLSLYVALFSIISSNLMAFLEIIGYLLLGNVNDLYCFIIASVITLICIYKIHSIDKFKSSRFWKSNAMKHSSLFLLIGHLGLISGVIFLMSLPKGGISGFFFVPFILVSCLFYLIGAIAALMYLRKAPNKVNQSGTP